MNAGCPEGGNILPMQGLEGLHAIFQINETARAEFGVDLAGDVLLPELPFPQFS